jgi:hypothetical protein
MRNERKRYAAAAAAFTIALGGAAVGGVVAHAQAAVPTVTVALKEFKITPALKLRAGKVTLVVVNKGKLPHALQVSGPGVSAKTGMLAAGKTARLTVMLKDGSSYKLWCPVGNHAALGMQLTAKLGAATAGTGGTGAGGTTSGGGTTTGGTDGAEWG